jgi:hypothetical protein
LAQRWNGTYALDPQKPWFEASRRGVSIVTAAAGSGMTLSFGLAEEPRIYGTLTSYWVSEVRAV